MNPDYDKAINLIKEVHLFRAIPFLNEFPLSAKEYLEKRNYFAGKYPKEIPSILKECRTALEFHDRVEKNAPGSKEKDVQKKREFIQNEFASFLNFLEFGESPENGGRTANVNEVAFVLHDAIFSHVKELFDKEEYSHAVSEAFKVVISRLREITGEEQAHKAFGGDNYTKIFGMRRDDLAQPEQDFNEGVKFLNMAIQNFRNEKAHAPATPMDKNLAVHYLALASLALKLIDREGE